MSHQNNDLHLKEAYPHLEQLFEKDKLQKPIKDIQEKNLLIPAFLSLKGLVKQHLDSFNYFIDYEMKNIIEAKHNNKIFSEVEPNFCLEYTDIKVAFPMHDDIQKKEKVLTPFECRVSDLTYAGNVYVDFKYSFDSQNFCFVKNINIGKLPIMLGCSRCHLYGQDDKQLAAFKECPNDPKGYFIIKGVEKVILIQEQMAKNRIIIEKDNKGNIISNVASSTIESKSRTTILMKNNKIYMKLTSFKENIPILIMFKALGVECEQEIFQLIGTEDYIVDVLSFCLHDISENQVFSSQNALEYLSHRIQPPRFLDNRKKSVKQPLDETRDILTNVLLPHVPQRKFDYYAKAVYLALMVRRLLQAIHDSSKIDDKDYYGNKRLESAGQLMSLLFEDKFKIFNSELKSELDKLFSKSKRPDNLKSEIIQIFEKNSGSFTKGIMSTVSSGNWNLKRFKMERAGVTQVLSRLSYIQSLGMMTRITSQVEKTRKISGPRALQGSHWGIICPSDTPDGESCGLQKHLALLTYITTDQDKHKILKIAVLLGVEDIGLVNGEEIHSGSNYIVFLNGQIAGLHRDPSKFTKDFRELRRKGIINEFVSISQDSNKKCITIAFDYGRLARPLIIVENGFPKVQPHHLMKLKQKEMNFNDFIKQGLIEYLDVNEEDNCLIALTDKELSSETTHLEIDPYSILGFVAGLIPYPHHNQSPRNTYQCAMGKQAIGIIGYNQLNRVDTLLYLLIYPQKPLVKTKTIELMKYEELPAGHNASVAVMSYSGYDIEDAIILNKASLDRGFGRIAIYKRYITEFMKYKNRSMDSIRAPDQVTDESRKKKHSSQIKKYHALDLDGLARIGEKLHNGDVYINKIVPESVDSKPTENLKAEQIVWKDQPAVHKGANPATVDRIILTTNYEVLFLIKTILREIRRPELGDKFSSRHGQKGVCGLIVNQEDMPFNESGWCPDLIMNPHGYPSRMTVGKMIELLAAKAGCLDGKFKYGTAFAGDKVADIGQILIQHGYSYTGKDCLISGTTGEYVKCYVFSGPIFYQRLKHLVSDKIHARARGPTTNLTRQPTEGRARDGGLRLGEMERDCLVGYGTSNLLLERLMISSDQYITFVCEKCGMFKYEPFCRVCKTDKVHKVKLPYPCKLLFQELLSMNIKPKIQLSDI